MDEQAFIETLVDDFIIAVRVKASQKASNSAKTSEVLKSTKVFLESASARFKELNKTLTNADVIEITKIVVKSVMSASDFTTTDKLNRKYRLAHSLKAFILYKYQVNQRDYAITKALNEDRDVIVKLSGNVLLRETFTSIESAQRYLQIKFPIHPYLKIQVLTS